MTHDPAMVFAENHHLGTQASKPGCLEFVIVISIVISPIALTLKESKMFRWLAQLMDWMAPRSIVRHGTRGLGRLYE